MTTRAQIIDLLLSDSEESLRQLRSLVLDAENNPNVKLTKTGTTVQTKTIRVPSKWMSPPIPAASPSFESSSRSKSLTVASSGRKMKLPTTKASSANQPNQKQQITPKLESSSSSIYPDGTQFSAPAGSEDGKFCVCGQLDDNPDETFIKCSVGLGGCNGWIHLGCAGLSESDMDDVLLNQKHLPKYVCSLCKEYISNRKTKTKLVDEVPPPLVVAKRTAIMSPREAMMKKLKGTKGR